MDFNSARPIYQQIKEIISREIARGDLHPGDKMTSLRDMALKLKVNPNTVQRAYRELEEEGILFTRRGQGTFVTEKGERVLELRKKMAKEGAIAYLEGARALGLNSRESIRLLEELLKGEEL